MYHPKDEAVQGTTRKQFGISILIPTRLYSFPKAKISHL
jgi:hypothetical protein